MDAIVIRDVEYLKKLFEIDDDFFNGCMRSVESDGFVKAHILDATENLYNRLKLYELSIARRKYGSSVVPAVSDDAIWTFAHDVAIYAYKNMNLL